MRKVGFIFIVLVFLIKPSVAQQLLRGQIIKAGSSVLDPNQDGFVSKTTAGFSTSTNYWVPEFEVNMFGIPQVNGDATGDNTGKSCGITDLIPDIKGHSVYAVKDANNNLIFRFRVGDNNPSVEAWTILLDTDGLFGANDPNATAENPGFEIDISLIKNQNFGVIVYNIDGLDKCSAPLITYPLDTHFQISVADEASCGDPDYFYDFYVPVSDLASAFGITINTGVRFAAATNVSATCAMGGKIADISGVNDDDPKYTNCDACAFTDIVSSQCPTAIVNLCATCSGFNTVPVNAPGINQPVRAGQTAISGTCDDGIYIVVQVFPVIAGTTNQWSNTPRETDAAYATGINWSVALAGPLQNYDKIVATAQKDANTPPCGLNGGSQSSTSVTVAQPNAPPVAQNQTVNVAEDTPTGITLGATDPDSDPLTYTLVSSPTRGTLTGTAPGLTYTPGSNYNGADTFTFKASDGIFTSNTATITINVTPVNDPPVANSQSATTLEDNSVGITLTGSDIEGSALNYIVVTQPQHGTLTGSGANLTYSPTANYNGVDNFTFKVNDGTVDSNSNATVLITITPVNDPPVANNQTVSLAEDVSTSIILSGSDPDGDPLTYTLLTQPAHGTLSGTVPNLTYTPTLNYNGGDSFTFKVNDGTVDSNTATVSITVTPVNDAPVANNQSINVTEDVAKAITLTASDVDGNTLTYSVVVSPTHGTLSGTAPNLTYTPAANYSGNDYFTFKVNDGTVDSNIATVSITVTPVNDAPVANNQNVTTLEDTQVAITLTGSDVDADAITFTVVALPTRGTLSGVAPNLTYTPAANYNGSDSFTFKVNDGTVDSNIATVSITDTPVNDAPVANNQSVSVTEDVAKAITLTASDVDGNTLAYTVVTSPTHGTLSGSAPNLTYTPAANYNGNDSFTFKANDGTVDSNIATVSITVTPVNDAPVANNQTVTVTEDILKSITLTGSDVDGNTITYIIVSSPARGTLSGTIPNLTYTPTANYNGGDSFTFKVNDGTIDSNTATITITVTPVNDVPIANDQSVTTAEDVAKAITLTANDVDGNALTYIVLSLPTHGTLSGSAPNLTYTPAANYNGNDNFTFKANDGTVDSNTATISITVTPVNDAPVANDKTVTTAEDTQVAITVTAVDPEGDALTYAVVTPHAQGTLIGSAPNFTYTPAQNYNGSDSFTFKANDGTVDSNTATVSITITSVNDVPIANNQSVIYDLNTPKAIVLTASDADGNTLTYSIVSGPTHGTLDTNSGQNITFTPDFNYNGSDQFTFKVNDGTVDSNIATVFLTFNTGSNNAPTAFDQSITTNEDVPVSFVIIASDPENNTLTYSIVTPPAHGSLTGTAPNLTYTPTSGYSGSDSFTFKVNDGLVDSNIATVSVSVIYINRPPVAASQSVSVTEDVAKPITLSATDADGSPLTYTVVSSPSHGTLSGSAPNLIYTPSANYNGNDSFTFKANDGSDDSNIATVSVTVTPVNDAPTTTGQTITIDEDNSVSVVLVGNDVDGDPLTYIIVTPPTNGTLTGSGSTLTYTPSLNYNGNDSFTFEVSDGILTSNVSTINIVVNPVNDVPTANNQSGANNQTVTTPEDTQVNIILTGSDVDNDPLTFTIVAQPSHGTLSGSAPNITYTPAANYNGSDSFTFKVNDGQVDSNIATISILVTPVNDSPIANDLSASVAENAQTNLTLTASDVDGDALSYITVSSPIHGALSGAAPNLTYTPTQNYNGSDSFTFKVNDGTVDSNIATVSITITAVNVAPVANSQSITTPEDTQASITLTGSDVDGDPITYSIVISPAYGTLSGTLPNLTYTPTADYNGSDSFTFKVNDGALDSNVATVSISVSAVPDAPVANASSIVTDEDTPASALLTGVDVDGNAITFSISTQPLHGVLTGTAPSLTYSPNLNFNGSDSFTFTVSDGTLTSAVATVSITVNSVNDAPVSDGQSVTLDEDTPTAIALSATDVDGDALTYTIATSPTNGTLSGTAPNLTYTPSANYFGIDSFTFYANDGTVNSNTSTVSLTITSVNDAPTTSNQTITVAEDNSVIITLTGIDVDGDQLTFTIETAPSHGTLTGSGSTLTYTPSPNYNGNDSFTYNVSDGTTSSNTSTVSITVTPVNDAPTANNQSGANNQSVATPEDTPVAIIFTASDVDGDPLTYSIVSAPTQGSLTGTPPNVTYSPALNFNGQDSFTFKANDGTADSNIATVTIDVSPVNDPPSILPIPTIFTAEDTQRLVCLSVVDVDSNVITFTSPNNLLGGGNMTKSTTFNFCFDFDPAKNYNGRSVWTLGACDDGTPSLCTSINVEIDITPVNDPPVAFNDAYDIVGRSENTFDVLANDLVIAAPYKEFYDIYQDSVDVLTIDRAVSFRGVSTIINNGKTILYTPNFDWIGPDSIRYRIYDKGGLYDSATVFINVGPPPFRIYQGLSPNGDGKNDYWHIDGIEGFPNNTIRIFDRFNNLVYETRGYSNESNYWTGQSNHGLVRGSLPEGTYFYSVELGDGSGPISGYVVVKRN